MLMNLLLVSALSAGFYILLHLVSLIFRVLALLGDCEASEELMCMVQGEVGEKA